MTRSRYLCPFCDEVVVEVDFPSAPSDADRIEGLVRDHLVSRHPIRRRLSRRFRRALAGKT